MEFNLSGGILAQVAEVRNADPTRLYDVLILGAGAAGLTAAVYSLRKGLATAMVSRQVGGQVAETAGIENYLGYRYIEGTALVDKFREQVDQYGIDFETATEVVRIEDGPVKKAWLADGRILQSRTLIVATGKLSKRLGVPGEEELIGHGVAFCAICDAPLYAGKRVVVAGGGNSGVDAAIDLAKRATHVTLVQRRDRLIADRVLIDKLSVFPHVEILLEHVVTAIHGPNKVSGVRLRDLRSNQERDLPTDGIFIEIGTIPNSGLVRGVVATNGFGEIIVDRHARTDKPGIFAAGDVTDVPYKQIIIACGEAAVAALSANEYLLSGAV